MKSPSRLRLIAALAFSAATLSVLPSASAAVIYLDDFSRTGPIQGTSPSPTNTLGSIWTDNAGTDGFQTNGSALVMAGRTADLDTLAFNLSDPLYANSIVSLSLDITMNTNGGQWVGLGFTGNNGNIFDTSAGAVSWATMFANGNVLLNKGPSVTQDQTINGAYASFSTFNARIDYNTGTKTATFYINNAQIGTPLSFTSTPTSATRVFVFGSGWENGNTASVDNFRLEVAAVPEPTTTALFALGAVGLAIVSRRKYRLG